MRKTIADGAKERPKPPTADQVSDELRKLANPAQAALLQRFFKTGPGEYAEGDRFLGLKVPVIRAVARTYRALPLAQVSRLLKSTIHEERLAALVILAWQFQKADAAGQERIYKLYLDHTRYINNWDLVDLSAPGIVGAFLVEKDRAILGRLAGSKLLWERRIAMLAAGYFIRAGRCEVTLEIAEILVNDKHDLIHKAVGWMLREVGKRDLPAAEQFLARHCKHMPRTMLRYAIERFPEDRRRTYLEGKPLD